MVGGYSLSHRSAPSADQGCAAVQVKKLIMGDEVLLGKYQDSLLSSYIEDNAMVRWCPSVPHCGNAVRAETDPHCEPSCSCGMRFCFACSDEPHSPCTCEMYAPCPPSDPSGLRPRGAVAAGVWLMAWPTGVVRVQVEAVEAEMPGRQ